MGQLLEKEGPMQSHRREIRDVLMLAQGLVYFIFIGAGTVAIAVAAHLHR
jgi:hypothetical protein